MKMLAGLLIIPLLAACAAGSSSPPTSERAILSSEIAVPSHAAAPSGGSVGLPAAMLDEVMALAEEETGVDRSAIEVVVAEAVTWTDGSIGCPEEGMMYTQALVPGYRVILNIAGEELAFHASETGEFSPCTDPIEPADSGTVDR